jgi:hypothetical protein
MHVRELVLSSGVIVNVPELKCIPPEANKMSTLCVMRIYGDWTAARNKFDAVLNSSHATILEAKL